MIASGLLKLSTISNNKFIICQQITFEFMGFIYISLGPMLWVQSISLDSYVPSQITDAGVQLYQLSGLYMLTSWVPT